MIRGVDVSSVQSRINWQSLAQIGIRFAIVKCSTGNDNGVDPYFSANVAGAKAAGLAVGGYHFAYPLPADPAHPGRCPKEQAQIAFDKCGGLGSKDGELPPCIDLEWPAPQDWGKWGVTADSIRAWGTEYLEAAEALWGRKPVVYTYPWFAKSVNFGEEPGYAAYPLWIADYACFPKHAPIDGSLPTIPAPWSTWTLWQHSGGTMRLPNGAPDDFDVFHGSEDDFAAFLRVAA